MKKENTMAQSNYRTGGLFVALALCTAIALGGEATKRTESPEIFGVFVGSTTNGAPIRELFDLPDDTDRPIRWELRLFRDPSTGASTRFRLHGDFERGPAEKSADRKKGV